MTSFAPAKAVPADSGSKCSGAISPRTSLKPQNRDTGDGGVKPSVSPTVVYLPFPPSNNNLFANGRKGRYPTKRYEGWKRVADNEFTAQKRKLKRVRGPVNLWLYLEDKDNRIKDADNFSKAAIDYCVKQRLIEKDDKSIVRSVHLIWSRDVSGCMVSIWPAPVHSEAA